MTSSRTKKRQLRSFRNVFRRLTADGTYPPERQQKLYQACQKAGLDWNEARHFVRPEAQKLLHRYIGSITVHRALQDQDIAAIQSLQRRLGLDDGVSLRNMWRFRLRPVLLGVLLFILLGAGGAWVALGQPGLAGVDAFPALPDLPFARTSEPAPIVVVPTSGPATETPAQRPTGQAAGADGGSPLVTPTPDYASVTVVMEQDFYLGVVRLKVISAAKTQQNDRFALNVTLETENTGKSRTEAAADFPRQAVCLLRDDQGREFGVDLCDITYADPNLTSTKDFRYTVPADAETFSWEIYLDSEARFEARNPDVIVPLGAIPLPTPTPSLSPRPSPSPSPSPSSKPSATIEATVPSPTMGGRINAVDPSATSGIIPSPASDQVAVFNVDEDFYVGVARIKVLGSENRGQSLNTTGQAIFVTFEVENTGKSRAEFPGDIALVVRDDQERKFGPLHYRRACRSEPPDPNIVAPCEVYYDIPTNAQELTWEFYKVGGYGLDIGPSAQPDAQVYLGEVPAP